MNSLINGIVSSCLKFWQNSQRLANRCDYSDIQERRSQAMHKLQRDITRGGVLEDVLGLEDILIDPF